MTIKDIYLAGGCFWGTEHFFKQIAGVVSTEVGFANGQTDNPTYEQVYACICRLYGHDRLCRDRACDL